MSKKKILVVLGGTSKERQVSLETGASCIKSLKKCGYKVSRFDPKFSSITDIKKNKAEAILYALHGKGGEDGKIHSFFEYLCIPYTHSGVVSSMLAMNKYFSKQIFIKNKIKTPNYFFLNKNDFYNVNLKEKIKKNNIKFPIVIKPNDEGSSIGVNICKTFKSLMKSFKILKNKYDNLIFESFIPGKEIQVAVIGGKAIGAIELRPKREFYDYTAKYKKSSNTLHVMPAEISKKKYIQALRIASKANKVLKCKGVVRCDFRFFKNTFYLLELNTQPGMTDLSLVPEILQYYKISFTQLVKWMVNDASLNR